MVVDAVDAVEERGRGGDDGDETGRGKRRRASRNA
tara:strand:- start:1053 stop:1157 length:105 start_codon:yes stop_codon:yes gene_type:complete